MASHSGFCSFPYSLRVDLRSDAGCFQHTLLSSAVYTDRLFIFPFTNINKWWLLSLSLSLFKYSSAALLVSLAKQPRMLASQTNHTHIHTQIHTRTQSLRRISNSIRRLQHRVRQPHTHTHIHGGVYRHTITVTHSLYTHTQRKPHTKSRRVSGGFDRAAWKCVPLMGEVRVMKPNATGRLVYHHLKEQSVMLGSFPELLILKNLFMF